MPDYMSRQQQIRPPIRHSTKRCLRVSVHLAEQQGVLTDILEVPSLMDICLRSGSYDDALDLRAFVTKIAVMQPDLQVELL